MTSAYTPLLGLVLPVTGELSGTWGTVWNDSGTSLIDSAISGTTTLSVDADATLTTTTGAANQARQAIILWTAGGTATRTITVPAQSKIYTVINKTSSTQSIKIVGAGPTTGVTIIAGESAVVAWNGVDFIKISNISGAGVFSSITNTGLTSGRVVYSTTGGLETDSANLTFNGTTLTANTLNLTNQLTTAYGGTGLTSYTAGDLPYYATGTALSKLAIGTAGQVLTVNSGATAPQWTTLTGVAVTTFSAGTTGLTPSTATSGAVTLAGTLATTNGGTGLTSFTANGVVYASSTSALATGTALTFDGTNLVAFQTNASPMGIVLRNDSASTSAGTQVNFQYGGASTGYIRNQYDGNDFNNQYNANRHHIWLNNGSEQMRLTSGNLLMGTTSAGLVNANSIDLDIAGGGYVVANHANGSSSGNFYVVFGYNGGLIGSITQSGTTAVLYNITSDQRLKENIVDAPEFGSVIDSIKVRSYDWKADGNHQRAGFVAQELVTVAPEAVHQPADPEQMMAVDYSKLVPMLVKEIQSLRKRLADAGI